MNITELFTLTVNIIFSATLTGFTLGMVFAFFRRGL